MRDRNMARSMRLEMFMGSKEIYINCIVRVVLAVLE
jgi:hypothetical protein